MNLDIVDRIENQDTGTVTLVVGDRDAPEAPGAMYHYAANPPAHAGASAEEWARQIAAHALGLEARSRGVPVPDGASMDPGELGRGGPAQSSAPAAAPLADDEQGELAQLRGDRAAQDQAERDRAELEQLRRERDQEASAPPA